MAEIIQLVRNDTGPALELSLSDSDGPADLSDSTVFFYLRRNPREGVLLTREATVPSNTATEGKAYVFWGEGDLDLPGGVYEAEIEIQGSGGARQTVFEIFEIEIRDDFA